MPQRPGEMSQTFKDQEEKNRVEKIEQEGKEAEKRTCVYWAPAAGYKIANFVPEKWSGGRCIQHEAPLAFFNHIYTADPDTDDGKNAMAFIEKSNAFVAGIIKKCKDMAEAQTHTAKLQAMRRVTQLRCESISMTNHRE